MAVYPGQKRWQSGTRRLGSLPYWHRYLPESYRRKGPSAQVRMQDATTSIDEDFIY